MPTVHYVWDELDDNILAEYDDAGNVVAEYTHEPGLHGQLISQYRNGQTFFHHYDGEGNTREVTEQNGNVVETATYSAFGEVVQKTSSIVNPFGFKGALGYYANPETNDLSYSGRVYYPQIGRWLSIDLATFIYAMKISDLAIFPASPRTRLPSYGELGTASPLGLIGFFAEEPDEEPDDDSACGPKKECISDFAARTGKADECLGFDINDVFCSKCTKSFKVVESCANVEVNVEQTGKPKCTIKFKSRGKKCGSCPKGGKRIVDGEVEIEK